MHKHSVTEIFLIFDYQHILQNSETWLKIHTCQFKLTLAAG